MYLINEDPYLLCHEHGSVLDSSEIGLLDLTSPSAAGSWEILNPMARTQIQHPN